MARFVVLSGDRRNGGPKCPFDPFDGRVAADHAKSAPALQHGHNRLSVQKKAARAELPHGPLQVMAFRDVDSKIRTLSAMVAPVTATPAAMAAAPAAPPAAVSTPIAAVPPAPAPVATSRNSNGCHSRGNNRHNTIAGSNTPSRTTVGQNKCRRLSNRVSSHGDPIHPICDHPSRDGPILHGAIRFSLRCYRLCRCEPLLVRPLHLRRPEVFPRIIVRPKRTRT